MCLECTTKSSQAVPRNLVNFQHLQFCTIILHDARADFRTTEKCEGCKKGCK